MERKKIESIIKKELHEVDWDTLDTGITETLVKIGRADSKPYPLYNSKELYEEMDRLKKIKGLVSELRYMLPSTINEEYVKGNIEDKTTLENIESIISEVKKYNDYVRNNSKEEFTEVIQFLMKFGDDDEITLFAQYLFLVVFLEGMLEID